MDLGILQIGLWLIAGGVSFYFSLNNARVWTSICLGFFLILIGEIIPSAVPFLPGLDIPEIQALGAIVSTIAIMVMTHGFMEYYVFSRTLELEGNKAHVFLGTGLVIAGSLIFVLVNPTPSARTLEIIGVIEKANWVFLSIINIDMIRKIYFNVKDTPISRGFLAFVAIFVFIFLWKGSQLYIEVYDLRTLAVDYPFRYNLSAVVANLGNLLASVTVGGTFLYLARLLR
ncbi:hypothetical protein SAMN05660860_01457 [Geoalkalibacter ferrihydriticus]|uniref:Uncharacterized protein n=2 Tax=Geoalkalibacter ferrihydriticus TaxID=392333 RepID=A0A0C2HN71_9BACT|nr:hypothetical protein [Geoalkalibacter ferrihydriticus]KIH76405.1 hypothetical protein GFER_09220 [Geoalkalibacter ferrihydriticus DSM 17813]SDL92861.1 hypothetical protein SAMN05660860_01457 [Geoalkalibacter ferrihydriticus]